VDARLEQSNERQLSAATLIGLGTVLVGLGAALTFLLRLAQKGGGEPEPALQCRVTRTIIRLKANGNVEAVNSTTPGQYRPTEVHLPRDPNDLRRFGIQWLVNNARSTSGRWVHIRGVDALFEPGQPLGAYIRPGRVEWFASCFRRDVPAGHHEYDIWVDNRLRLDPEIVIIRDLI
jgi:hypothetical protein